MSCKYLPALLLAAASLPVAADALRSVDPEGTVTFSDAPVPGNTGATRVPIDAPAPAPDSMTESQREAQEVIDKARRIQPVESTSGQSKTQARQSLDKARADLEAAKQVRTGDRQGTATGGSRLTPQYTQRVQAAEQRVQEAEQQLEQAR